MDELAQIHDFAGGTACIVRYCDTDVAAAVVLDVSYFGLGLLGDGLVAVDLSCEGVEVGGIAGLG